MAAVTLDDIKGYYQSYLNRDASAAELRYWEQSGLDRKGVEMAIRNSPEHQRLIEKHRPKELPENVTFDVYFGTDENWHNTSRNTLIFAPNVRLRGDEYKDVGDGFFWDEGRDRGGVFGMAADITGINEIRKISEDIIPSEFWPVADLYMFGYGSAITGGRQAVEQSRKWYGEEGLQWMRFAGDTALRIGLNYMLPIAGGAVAEAIIGGAHAGVAWGQGLEADYRKILTETAINAGIALGTGAIAQGFGGVGPLASLKQLGLDPRMASSVTVGMSSGIRSYITDRDIRKALLAGAAAGTANYLLSKPGTPETMPEKSEVASKDTALKTVESPEATFDPYNMKTWYSKDGQFTPQALEYFTEHSQSLQTAAALMNLQKTVQPAVETPWYKSVLSSGAFWAGTISSLVAFGTAWYLNRERDAAESEAQEDLNALYSGLGGGGGGGGAESNAVQYYSVYAQRGVTL